MTNGQSIQAWLSIFFCSKQWSIDVAAVCCRRCDSLRLLQKLNRSEVVSILLKLRLNFPWSSCSMLDRFSQLEFFSHRKVSQSPALLSGLNLSDIPACAQFHIFSGWIQRSRLLLQRSKREQRVVMEENMLLWLLFSALTSQNFFGWHERAVYTPQCLWKLVRRANSLLTVKQFCCFNTYRSRNSIIFLEIVENRHW